MKILVINAGSSSLKYQLFDMTNRSVLAKGLCERIGIEGGKFKYTAAGKDAIEGAVEMATHADAIRVLTKNLTDSEYGVLKSMDEIDAVGHRVLHGGAKFSASVLIDEKVKEAITECIPLGPLHNPANLIGINACEDVIKGVPQVAVFDTAFHQTMPDYAYMYGLPYEFYEKHGIRRYGFHGTSHRYVSARAAEFIGADPAKGLKMITCHLGNGSSIAAVKDGKCVDTSMGLTPLEGMIMGTRCGAIDPAIVVRLTELGYTPAEVNNIMNKKSGFLGISGISSDCRDLCAAADAGNERAQLALKMFEYEILKYIGSYAAAMGGLDVLVFTGGIGENTKELRQSIGDALAYMGVAVDSEKNNVRGVETDISAAGAKVKTLIIPTNEELMIAMDTAEIVNNK